jgi:hypothetical protein
MDGDGLGDPCDNNLDGDRLLNGKDNCPSVYNPTQEDSDRDGFGDICDSENNFAVLDLAANKVVVFDLSARMLSEKKFDGMGTVYFIAPSINGWLVKGCPTSGCAMSNWIIWDLNPDLSIRNTITNQMVAHGYAPLASGNFVSSNIYTGDIDLYDTSGTIIKSINVWEEKDGWPYEYKKLGDVAALVKRGFVVTPEGGFPVDGPFTPFLYFYDNDLTLINKVDISGDKIHLFYLTGLDNGGFAATCSDCGTNNNNVDSVCFFSPEGELINRINITGDITGSLYLMDVFLTGLKGGGVIVSTRGSDKVWIYHSPPQELVLSGAGITNIGALAGNIFPTQFAYILVSGSVCDLVSGEPIDGAEISTDGIGHDISRNGEYIFSEVQGKWTISARAEGYAYYTSTLNMDTEDEYVLKNISMYPLTAPECRTASDCDDGQYCTGTETCVKGRCVHSGNPCASYLLCIEETDQCVEKECSVESDCDDGQFCNGEEACAGGICQAGAYPCADPTPQCDEADDRCTEGPSITLFPNPYFQSRWMPMLLLLQIVGTETHFDGSSQVAFNPKNGVMAIPMLGDRRHIFMIGLLMPRWISSEQSIEVTVTTGSEMVAETLKLNSLPFMLDEQGEILKEVTP